MAIRKTIGAERRQLIWQFIAEASALVLLAAILSIVLMAYSLGFLNQNLEKAISMEALLHKLGIVIFLTGLLLTILLTGLYPAWLIPKVKAVSGLKSKWSSTGKSTSDAPVYHFGNNAHCPLFIAQQIQSVYTQNLGFDKDNILLMKAPDPSKYEVLA